MLFAMTTTRKWDQALEALLALAPEERFEHVNRIRFAMQYQDPGPTPQVLSLADKLLEQMPLDVWVTRAALVASVPGRSGDKSEAIRLLRTTRQVEYDGGATHKYRRNS